MSRQPSQASERRDRWVGLLALLLFVCAAATVALLSENALIFADEGEQVIEIVPSGAVVLRDANAEAGGAQVTAAAAPTASYGADGDDGTEVIAYGYEDADATAAASQAAVRSAAASPRTAAAVWQDDKQVWSAETEVEIFRISYENSDETVTVEGIDGDKLIAPGTSNSYSFWLQNGGNAAVRYTVELEAYISPEDTALPVLARVANGEETYITGGDYDPWVNVAELNGVNDAGTLAAGRRAEYTLEWQWPFEQDDDEYDTDEYDTWLGNLAAASESEDEDLTLTIVIKTVAEADTSDGGGTQPLPVGTQTLPDPDATVPPDSGGDAPPDTDEADDGAPSGGSPKTGDDFNFALYITLLAVSAAGIVLLLLARRKRKREDDSHEKTARQETRR